MKNLATERDGLSYLAAKDKSVYVPTKDEKLMLLALLKLPAKFVRTFDAIRLKVSSFKKIKGPKDFELLELKVTQKHLENFPAGFFFGMTKNEDDLMKKLEPGFKLCLVSMAGEGQHCFLTHSQLHKLIKHKRVQYQVNL